MRQLSDGERDIWSQMQQDAAPSHEEEYGALLQWIWDEAIPRERWAITRERIAQARERGDPRCPACNGRRRAACDACTGAGYDEPALRDLTTTEERIYHAVLSDQAAADEREESDDLPF